MVADVLGNRVVTSPHLVPTIMDLQSALVGGSPRSTTTAARQLREPLACGMETARERAQIAAGTMVRWANRWKMVIAGEETQTLDLSQWSHDAKDFQIKVAGTSIKGSRTRDS